MGAKERNQRYRESHKEELKEKAKIYYLANKERCKASTTDWRRRNKVKDNNDQNRRRQRAARILRAYQEFTGCELCGYNRSGYAMDFHHVNPADKDIIIGNGGHSLGTRILESFKCAILCSNCHREVEAGIRDCPDCLAPAYA